MLYHSLTLTLHPPPTHTYTHTHRLTALHYAVQNNSLSSLKAFAKLPEVTHLPDNDGRTPLMVAAMNGFDEALTVNLYTEMDCKRV